VRLRIVDPLITVDLGARSHHYCLVTLARKRLVDASSGMAAADQGWLECQQLAKMLGIDPSHLNIQIYRLRHQVMSARPDMPGLASIVERRRGEVRMGDFAFEIQQGARAEGQYSPSSPRHATATLAR
jgi:hypothetical protein